MGTTLHDLHHLRDANSGKRISFVSGNFKIIHAGHIRLLRFAREMADMLVVGVLPHNDFNARVSETDRLENVRSLNMVDYACILDTPLQDALFALQPNVVVKGKEHENLDNPELAVLDRIGSKLVFSSGSTTLLEPVTVGAKIVDAQPSILYPHDYMERHAVCASSLKKLLAAVDGIRVMVVGDVIVDEYINCEPLGMSQEDPTIVVTPSSTHSYLGGAGIVAAHASGLGASVRFFTVCGHDQTADLVSAKLQDYAVEGYIFNDETRPTSLKQRFRCQGKTMLRVSHLRPHALDKRMTRQILQRMLPLLDSTDLLIFSDFNYGCLSPLLVGALSEEARTRNIRIVADSQSSSQLGDVSRFVDTDLLTPTEREARLAVHDFESGMVVLADKLLRKSQARNVVLTLGEAGMLIQQGGTAFTDHLPAMNTTPKDVAGAGDCLLVGMGVGLTVGGDIWHAACLGALAAAVQVGREGNVPLKRQELIACMSGWD